MYLSIPDNKPITRQEMMAYLARHRRYDTMNSWNRSTSYAHCIKVDRLGLTSETCMRCLEMLGVDESFEDFSEILRDFDRRHQWRWQISQNGRSGGYLVLIQGGKGPGGRIFLHPGKSLDMNEDFQDWGDEALAERFELVWDFDQTCEEAVAAFVAFAETHRVEEREVLVPQTVRVAVPLEETEAV